MPVIKDKRTLNKRGRVTVTWVLPDDASEAFARNTADMILESNSDARRTRAVSNNRLAEDEFRLARSNECRRRCKNAPREVTG